MYLSDGRPGTSENKIMQVSSGAVQWINSFYKGGPHFKKLRPVKFCRSLYYFKSHPRLLLILFRIKYPIQLAALVAGAIFIYEGASVVKNTCHSIPGGFQEIFYYPLRFIEDKADI